MAIASHVPTSRQNRAAQYCTNTCNLNDQRTQPRQQTELIFTSAPDQLGFQSWSQLQSLSVPRSSQTTPGFSFSSPVEVPLSIDQVPELMNEHNHWKSSQGPEQSPYTPRAVIALPNHQRNSSLSTLASAGPSSPYAQTTSNPHIAIDPASDGFTDSALQEVDDSFYGGKQRPLQDSLLNYPSTISHTHQPSGTTGQHTKSTLLHPHIEFHYTSSTNPMSVASSNSGDSPISPHGDEHQHKQPQRQTQLSQHHIVPKFDRTMTDVYQDELFNPNFPITSTTLSPSTPSTAVSPSSEIFNQRLQAANTQHLRTQSPATTVSRERSPFRQGSPLAPISHDFVTGNHNNRPHQSMHHQSVPAVSQRDGQFSRQQFQSQVKPERDAVTAAILRRQQMMPRQHHETESTKTISPKDAMLDFSEPSDAAHFSLFPDTNTQFMGLGDGSVAQSTQSFSTIPVTAAHSTSFNNFIPTSLTDQFSYIARAHNDSDVHTDYSVDVNQSHSQNHQSQNNPTQLHSPASPLKPSSSTTDRGTFTCTYQGCPQRFETPTLLQKHKREGHRQVHGIGPSRRDTMLTGATSTQNGPHKCIQINPSTGKPCNTEFSRPYDLTRHEDTIHNPKKRKVSCPICTDKKQFSRGDALSRHYRVCHPEMPPPSRRRGGPARG